MDLELNKDVCNSINSNAIHQLNKPKDNRKIYPLTFVQAVYDARNGKRLDTILDLCNNVYLYWKGSAEATRLLLPLYMRRKGIIITYKNNDNEVITEKFIGEGCIADELFKLDINWVRITDGLTLSGDITIGSNGNWFNKGVDTGYKAQGPKGDNGISPLLKVDDGFIKFSYNNIKWYELVPLIEITPSIKIGKITTLSAGSNATVNNIGSNKNVILDFGIPMGNTGAKGDKGDGLDIIGFKDNEGALPKSNNKLGDTYMVGTSTPYNLYMYNGKSFVNMGSINEIKASVIDGGRADSVYGGARSFDCGGAL